MSTATLQHDLKKLSTELHELSRAFKLVGNDSASSRIYEFHKTAEDMVKQVDLGHGMQTVGGRTNFIFRHIYALAILYPYLTDAIMETIVARMSDCWLYQLKSMKPHIRDEYVQAFWHDITGGFSDNTVIDKIVAIWGDEENPPDPEALTHWDKVRIIFQPTRTAEQVQIKLDAGKAAKAEAK